MLDPAFPTLHIRPERGWLNDPNGVCQIDGRYHIFYQYNPAAPHHKAITWGHSTSTDLIHWDHLGVALVNRPGHVDAAGCWSGCITDDDGVPTAVYTAVPDHAWNAGVVLARSDRTLQTWVQDEVMTVKTPDEKTIGEVRDPFIFTFAGHRYAVQGAGAHSGRPQLLLYGCDDLTSWSELGALLTDDDPVAAEVAEANIWECPNLFDIDGRWVVLLSLWRSVEGTHQLVGVRYLVGALEARDGGPRFRAEAGGVVDSGPTFYAPQVLVGADRTLLWAWAWEQDRTPAQVTAAGWAGVLTFPRELYLAGSELSSRPAAELLGLRTGELEWTPGHPFAAQSFEVVASGSVALLATAGDRLEMIAEVPDGTGPTRILIDASMVEVFAASMVRTSRHYPGPGDQWVLHGDPNTTTVYALGR